MTYPNWFELVKTAAVGGTQRSPLETTLLPVPIRERLADQPSSPEAQLLDILALTVTSLGAGYRTAPTALSTELTDWGSPIYCSARSAQLWEAIMALENKRPNFEQHWLRRCLTNGWVIRPEMIVPMLDWCASKKMTELHPMVAQAIGARGHWIATQYKKWNYAAWHTPEDTWREGTPAVRQHLLGQMRQQNPTEGLALLASTFATETAENLDRWLAVLRTRLSQQDESTLMQWRTSLAKPAQTKPRFQQVLLHTTQLLLSIPDAALPKDWTTQLRRYFGPTGFQLPATDDDFFHPTLLVSESGLPRRNEMQEWFSDLLSAIPPSIWTGASGLSGPETMQQLAKASPEPEKLLEQLIKACLANEDAEAATWLIELAPHQQKLGLLALLPPMAREKYILVQASTALVNMLWESEAITFEWSDTFSTWVLKELYQSWMGYYFTRTTAIMSLDVYLHPQTRPANIPGLDDRPNQRNHWLDQIVPELERLLVVKRTLYSGQ